MTPIVRLTRVLLAGACLSVIGSAAAQDPAPAAEPVAETTNETTQTSSESEEVVVTATRRATKIQATPIAITAVGQKAIENAGVRETQSLTQVVPALAFPQSESSASVTARIRGVGTQGSNPGLESAVGIFIDGVYRSRNSVAFGDLGDIQRVEVLRGPQGTLFGRNTSAGLISVITREPDMTKFSANASATYESFDGYYMSAGVTGPLSDTTGIRLFGSYRQRDGYMRIFSGPLQSERDGNAKESWNLRGQFLWQPSDDMSLRIIVDGGHRDDECCYAAVMRPGGPSATGLTVAQALQLAVGYPVTATYNSVEDQIGYANRTHPQIVDEYGMSAEFNAELGFGTLTSITAYRDWKLSGGADSDYTAADILWADPDVGYQQFKTFTQEFRLAGSTDWVDWLVGAFYSNETLDRETSTLQGSDTEGWLSRYRLSPLSNTATRTTLGAVLGPTRRPTAPAYTGGNTHALGTGLNDRYKQTSDSIALFTHNVFSLTDSLKLTLGLRYTSEKKDVEATYRTNASAGCAYLESVYGYNPAGRFGTGPGIGTGDAAGAPGAALFCLPWVRTALDVLTATAPLQQSKEENEFSGIVTLGYEVNENLNIYGTYSRGYKAGGFNLDRYFSIDNGTFAGSSIVRCPDGSDGSPAQGPVPANPYTCATPNIIVAPDLSFAPEFVDAYEIGAKATLAGGALQLNLALYHQTFENYQLNTFNGISFVVTSVPKVIADGLELDMTWFTPLDGLTVTGGLAWTDTRYGENLGDLSTPGSFIFENPNLFYLPGQNLTSAPVWTVTGGATYETPVFGGAWTALAHMDLRYTSSQRTGSNLDPNKTQEGYYLINFRFGLESEDERFALEFWVRNALNERYFQITFDAPTQGPRRPLSTRTRPTSARSAPSSAKGGPWASRSRPASDLASTRFACGPERSGPFALRLRQLTATTRACISASV